MFGQEYLFKELFLVTDPYDTQESVEIVMSLNYEGVKAYIEEEKTKYGIGYSTIYHGVLIPANLLLKKIEELSEVYVLSIETSVNNTIDNNEVCKIIGSFSCIPLFKTVDEIKEEIINTIQLQANEIEDYFVLLGYKINTVKKASEDDIDEQQLETIKEIASCVEIAANLIRKMHENMMGDATNTGVDMITKYKPVEKLIGANWLRMFN